MANATDYTHIETSEFAKFVSRYVSVLDGVSLLLCLLVSFALYKSRDKWRSSIGSYVEITFVLIIANVVKSGQLLLYHYIEKDGDSLSCALQGFLLIGTEVFQQLCIVVLAVECTIILTYAINRARFVKKSSYVPWPMRRCIANPSVRFTCSLTSLFMITALECVALELLYGFGSDKKHPRLCNFKFYEGPAWDSERIMVYNWVTFTTPIASLCLGVFLIAYVYGQGYGKKHAPTSGIWKLAFIPTMYFALQTPFLLSEVFSVRVSFSILKIAGHGMPGMLALSVWYQNSYVRNYISGHSYCCCCAQGKKMENNHDSRSLQMEGSFRQSLISSSFEEGGYEVTGRLKTSTESLMDNFIENIENLEIHGEDEVPL